ncbi:hypothetical protein [Methanohalobium evestigatum]|nr:hypothetical protein [Methanohalobium evestigatum]
MAIALISLLTAGCTEQVVQEISEPNIKLSSWNHDNDASLSKGVVTDVTYTLYNSGDADGVVDVVIVNGKNEVLARSSEYIRANSRVTNTLEADTSIDNEKIGIKLKNQRKAD